MTVAPQVVSMTDIGVVGAGVAAAAATYVVDGALPGASVTVLEASAQVSGRAVTGRNGSVTYDHGANYLKDDDERVAELVRTELDEGLVEADGPVYVFDRTGQVRPGRDDDEHKWSYRTGLATLGERLLDATDATVHRGTRVASVARSDGDWYATDDAGTDWGPFDVVVMNPPAPRTIDLLAERDVADAVAAAASDVEYRSIWSAALHYPFAVDRPYYGLVNTDKEHAVGWISREECKPGHVPEGESMLIVQANHDWSVAHRDDPPAANVAALARHAASIMDDDRLASPDWTDYGDWRFALPEQGAHRGALRTAEAAGLYCVGDWVVGEARLHAALRNGLDTGERLVYAL
jgi:hypothetical protein